MKSNKIAWFALGPVATALFGLITIPTIAWAFPVEDVGRLNVLQISIQFSVLLLSFGLDQAYVREYYLSEDREGLLKTCFLPGFIMLLLVGLVAIKFDSYLSDFLYGIKAPLLFWTTFGCVVVAYLSRFLSLILRMQERGLAFSMSQVIPKVVLLLLIVGIVYLDFPKTFFWLQRAFFVSIATVSLVYLSNTKKEWLRAIKARFQQKKNFELLRFGFPLAISGVAYWCLASTSTIALRTFSSLTELGIYAVAMNFAAAVLIVQAVFSLIWAPMVYKWAADGVDMDRVNNITQQAIALITFIYIFCGVLSWSIGYILPPEYHSVRYLLLGTIIQPLFYTLSEVTSIGIGITRRTLWSIWIVIAALLTNVLLCIFLVPHLGAAGAVTANIFAYLVFLVARTEVSARIWRGFPRFKLYIAIFAISFLGALHSLLSDSFYYHTPLFFLLILPIVYKVYKSEIFDLTAFAKKMISP